MQHSPDLCGGAEWLIILPRSVVVILLSEIYAPLVDSKLSGPRCARVTQLSTQAASLLQDVGDAEQVGSDGLLLIAASKHSPSGQLSKGQLGTQRRTFIPS